MKFGKRLSNQIEETLPEWRDKFLSYKDLKKRLKLIEPKDAGDRAPAAKRQKILSAEDGGDEPKTATVAVPEQEEVRMTKEEADFIKLLEGELEKFNSFFVEKEEEYIIRLKEFQDRLENAKTSPEDKLNVRKEIVDFHGEMILLENYSALNYTGLVKILKKYDKRTGALIRLPFIQKVLQQPFFTTDLIYKLVKRCERMLDTLFCTIVAPPSDDDIKDPSELTTTATITSESNDDSDTKNGMGLIREPKELAEIEYVESLYLKSTVSALRSLKEIRSHSSTVSEFSLPPLQLKGGVEETWKKIPVREQVAK